MNMATKARPVRWSELTFGGIRAASQRRQRRSSDVSSPVEIRVASLNAALMTSSYWTSAIQSLSTVPWICPGA